MGDDATKRINLVFYAIIFLCVVQVAGLAYMRKKFDDNISILQNSESVTAARVQSIESMLNVQRQTSSAAVNKPQ
jgi:hypothetical protein